MTSGQRAAQARWDDFLAGHLSAVGLQRFHAREKMLLLAFRPDAYRELGRLAAGGEPGTLPERRSRYGRLFVDAFREPAKVGGHVNAMQHLAGHLKGGISAQERAQLAASIARCREPRDLVLPRRRLRELLQRTGQRWPLDQTYLDDAAAGLDDLKEVA